MKVLFVTRGWPTKANPMSGNYEAVQAKALAKRGIDVTVVYLERKSLVHAFESRKVRRLDEDGIMVLSTTVIMVELPGIKATKYNHLDLNLCQRAFDRVYQYYRSVKGDADVIHAHLIVNAHVCRSVLREYHIPFVITEHWSKMNYATLSTEVKRLTEAYSWADKVVCVSKELAESLKEKLGVDGIVIHNMVSDNFFDLGEEPKRVFTKSDIVKFISVGSLIKIKGFDIIINALQQIRSCDKYQLGIVGSGPEEANLRQLIEDNGLQDKVFLLGQKTPKEVSALIAESDCFILTSRRETFGIVYIEAMAKGKPVIATRCGGPENFVDESNGILIPADDVAATTKAIDEMVANINKYDSSVIRDFCFQNFSEEAIVKKILTVYKEVIKNA